MVSGKLEDIKVIENWFIVDLGFSNGSKSCGIYSVKNNKVDKSADIYFGNLKSVLSEYLQGMSDSSKIGLILEAPLSIAFEKLSDGGENPIGREALEYCKETQSARYWYYGAGATVTLAALNFLNSINDLVQSENIHFYEGFVSFKNNKDKKKEPEIHWKDAELLYNAIKDDNSSIESSSILNTNDTKLVLKSLCDIGSFSLSNGGIPSVIKVNKDNGITSFYEQ